AHGRAQPEELRGLRVLIVHGSPASRRTLERLLAGLQMKPVCVDRGDRALDEMKQAEKAGKPFALAVIAGSLPDMDAFMLAEQTRQEPALAGTVLVITSGAGLRGDAARCQELRIAAYLTEPMQPYVLREAVLAALAARDEERPAGLITRHSLRKGRRPLRILLAEDNPVNQEHIVLVLAKQGHEVVTVENGREALSALEREWFDLVLMDVQMPEMNGLEAAAAI
ncbi:unnamed protein product, partial [marine sediment metagenome]